MEEKGMDGLTNVGILSQQNNDTLKKIIKHPEVIVDEKATNFGYNSVSSLDSLQQNGTSQEKVGATEYWFLKKWLTIKKENTNEEIRDKFIYSFTSNLSKVLFLFMPIFALILFFFHDKKRWNYFDHGIFTLHYFSFLLLVVLLLFFIDKIYPLLEPTPAVDWTYFVLKSLGIIWMIYYFFPAHRRFYEQPFVKSFFKCWAIIFINLVLVSFLMVFFALYTYNAIA
jgi:hypothetical protein